MTGQANFYEVVIADNSRFMDESAYHIEACFDTYEEAACCARSLVDEELLGFLGTNNTAESLLDIWETFGSDPFIRPSPISASRRFSAQSYVVRRARELTALTDGPSSNPRD